MIAQKATILCIFEVLKKYTDENHILSAEKIREKLKLLYDIDMERRAVYRNIDALCSMGIEIEGYRENRKGYYLVDREFELSEIRLLCDAVAASDLIKEETGKTIIRKLIGTQSVFQGRLLQKTVFVKSEKRILNKQLFYNIDTLNVAINQGCKVRVKIMEYSLDHTLAECSSSPVVFSPYVTLWAEGNYYILARREGREDMEHFRIDLMKDVTLLERGIDMIFGGFNPSQYAKKYIFENGEKKETFEIECQEGLWQNMADTFGKDAKVVQINRTGLTVRILAVPSKMKAWIFEHFEECRVVGPRKFRDEIQRLVMDAYGKYCR